MKKTKFYITLIVICIFLNSKAQTSCKCLEVFEKIKSATEENYSAFFHTVNLLGNSKYQSLVSGLKNEIIFTNVICPLVIFKYFDFFQDNHISFYAKYLDKNEIANKFQDKVRINLGIWQYSDTDLYFRLYKYGKIITAQVINNTKNNIDTSEPYFYFFQGDTKNSYLMLANSSKMNLSSVKKVELKGNEIFYFKELILKKIKKVIIAKSKSEPPMPPLLLKKIDKENFYIKIEDLVNISKKEIDSAVQANGNLISHSKNLIIDFRDNFGGSVMPTYSLRPYIYTSTFSYISSYIKASDSILKYYSDACASSEFDYEPQLKKYYCDTLLPLLKKNKGALVKENIIPYIQDSIYFYPKNVAILINKNTSSAAEMVTYSLSQSKKVTIFGENSFGAFDATNGINYAICGYDITLPMEMNEFVTYRKYDNIGIEPDVKLSKNENNWIKEVVFYFQKK